MIHALLSSSFLKTASYFITDGQAWAYNLKCSNAKLTVHDRCPWNCLTHARMHTPHTCSYTHSHKAASCLSTLFSASFMERSSSVLSINKSWALLGKRLWGHAEDHGLLQALPWNFPERLWGRQRQLVGVHWEWNRFFPLPLPTHSSLPLLSHTLPACISLQMGSLCVRIPRYWSSQHWQGFTSEAPAPEETIREHNLSAFAPGT